MSKWIKEMPKAAGRYWIRDSDGDDAGVVDVVPWGSESEFLCAQYPGRSKDGKMSVIPGTCWGGYFWTTPLDPIPPFKVD